MPDWIQVDIINAHQLQAILEAPIQKYASIICFSYFAFADKSLLGDYLADYVENGKDSIFFDSSLATRKRRSCSYAVCQLQFREHFGRAMEDKRIWPIWRWYLSIRMSVNSPRIWQWGAKPLSCTGMSLGILILTFLLPLQIEHPQHPIMLGGNVEIATIC